MTKENKWLIIISAMFATGIIMGCLYCSFIKDDAALYVFLQDFIASIKDGVDKSLIFRKTLVSGIKIICLFFVCAMMKYGFIPICGITVTKSFSIGFTLATLFKYFEKNGIWVMMSQIPSNVLLFMVIVFFGTVCSGVGFERKEKGIFIKLMAVFLISCIGIAVSAFVSGYVDTYILNFVAKKLY